MGRGDGCILTRFDVICTVKRGNSNTSHKHKAVVVTVFVSIEARQVVLIPVNIATPGMYRNGICSFATVTLKNCGVCVLVRALTWMSHDY